MAVLDQEPRRPPGQTTAPRPADGVAERFRALAATADEVPLPGSGRTRGRLGRLRAAARESLPLARLVEGHLDALAILHDAGRSAPPGALLGVWAAEPGGRHVRASPAAGGVLLSGTKPFASGAGLLTHALVTARAGTDRMIALVDLAASGVSVQPGFWQGVGMRDALTGEVAFNAVVDDDALLGGPGFYLARAGFWHGAVGVAACWAGGIDALVAAMATDAAERPSPHRLAHLGAADARVAALSALLGDAATAIDHDPGDREGDAERLALRVRCAVAECGHEVLTRCAKAVGAAPLATDPGLSQRIADLQVYLGQHHAEQDAERLGRLVAGVTG